MMQSYQTCPDGIRIMLVCKNKKQKKQKLLLVTGHDL
jgi:hypothetical protein